MKLIADCGSTKTHWCLLDNDSVEREVYTVGMNAILLTAEEMQQIMRDELLPQLGSAVSQIDTVYFYGAGCLGGEICANVAGALRAVIPAAAHIEVDTDLLAAARALCGHRPGVACILGTGSNSCYYDGREIIDNVSPLGYILGDEGSGAVLGKILVGDVLKQQLPADLCRKFLEQYSLDRMTIIRRVYKEPGGNRFLASLSPFLLENIGRPENQQPGARSLRGFLPPQYRQLSAGQGLPGQLHRLDCHSLQQATDRSRRRTGLHHRPHREEPDARTGQVPHRQL